MSKFIFNEEKYLEYNNMTRATAPKHIVKFLNECQGKEVETSWFTLDKKWEINVYDVKDTNWCIPCERLQVYCDEVNE